MSPLCDRLAVSLVCHFHPLHCRHASGLLTGADQEDGGRGGNSRDPEAGGSLVAEENVPEERTVSSFCFRVTVNGLLDVS